MMMKQCSLCKHLDTRGWQAGDVLRCTAFPDGIPDKIATEQVLHLESYPNDRGVQYEASEWAVKANLDMRKLQDD